MEAETPAEIMYSPVPTLDDGQAAEVVEAIDDGVGRGNTQFSVGVERWVELKSDMYGWLLSTVARERIASREFMAQVMLLLANFCMQLFFVKCVHWLNKDFIEHSSSCECTLLIQLAGVCFWEIEMWSEITETLDLAELIYYVQHKPLDSSASSGSVWQDCLTAAHDFHERVPWEMSFWQRQSSKDRLCVRGWSSEECLALLWPGHLEWSRKIFLVIFMLGPKLMVAVYLAYVGGVYIFLSKDDEAVILSIVYAEFILRTDEILFASFAIPEISSLIKKAQPIGFNMSKGSVWTTWRTSSFLCMTIDPLIVFLIAYSVLVFGVEEERCPSEEQWWL
eukprot:gnl/TRDRNA2_/TRDRNA2_138275_c0_seq1.p1 gnl/TRDRNA2_/TRDRNA2_138275_c0~~gnl/TRDRNA2_/TRDRNA2_138275_c0_seq1.p1  ORF type:complete len:336 (+),score=41.78 gnl/TRDRNA2_/TRDRNA2_138275_c0_seq1:105-1112(+)